MMDGYEKRKESRGSIRAEAAPAAARSLLLCVRADKNRSINRRSGATTQQHGPSGQDGGTGPFENT